MKKLLLSAVTLIGLSATGQTVDFDQIRNWSGSGPNRGALVVQFETRDLKNPGALVWGFRWKDGDEPTGYDMVKAIAGNTSNLCVLVQMTGTMGYTLDGIGYSPDILNLLSGLEYDLDGAAGDSRISFGFYSPNTSMGQSHAPGGEALDMVNSAIEEAVETHVILHPLNYEEFGYPAYDYDWWKFENTESTLWNSGWYDGYWSYWTGKGSMADLGYSGLGMSSVVLKNGDIHGWKYLAFDRDDPDWLDPVYVASDVNTGIKSAENTDACPGVVEYYSLSGLRLSEPPAKGFYIEKRGESVIKRNSK